jgi:sugar phosphate isomerase/epimerase
MKFGTQLGSLGLSDRKQALALARHLGCQGLEVSLPVADLRDGKVTLDTLLGDAEALRRDFAEAGMEFISLTPGIMLKHTQHPDVIRGVCETANVLGVRMIRMFGAPHVRWGGPNSKLDAWMAEFDGTRDARQWLQRDAEQLERLLELSATSAVRYVFELHHGYVVNSASGAMRLLERHPPDRVGIIMDPGNMVFEGNEGWRNSVQIMGEYLAYLHCKNGAYRREGGAWQHTWAALEEGIANFAEIITALKDIGFQGYLSIEDLRRDLDPAAKISQGLAYLKRLVASPQRVLPT